MGLKLYLIGHARSGKDLAAEKLAKLIGLKYEASSMCCARIFIFDALKDRYGYDTIEECFEDRHNHRSEWFDLIASYNENDLTRLSAGIFENNDCYVGIRSAVELEAAKKRWSDVVVIWIDAEGRVEPEDASSCTVTKEQAHIVVENKGSLEEYNEKLGKLAFLLAPHITNVFSLGPK